MSIVFCCCKSGLWDIKTQHGRKKSWKISKFEAQKIWTLIDLIWFGLPTIPQRYEDGPVQRQHRQRWQHVIQYHVEIPHPCDLEEFRLALVKARDGDPGEFIDKLDGAVQ